MFKRLPVLISLVMLSRLTCLILCICHPRRSGNPVGVAVHSSCLYLRFVIPIALFLAFFSLLHGINVAIEVDLKQNETSGRNTQWIPLNRVTSG